MAAARPVVSVQHPGGSKSQTALPAVFLTPIRDDIVQQVHAQMALNSRQAYAVSRVAGHQTAAESWGTGRAVSRIPRVPGSGTHRAGQGAFGNMCRGGRMFAPTKTWRKWHRKINKKQRRHAVAAALAATAVPALVMARGHRVEQVPEIPLVVADEAINDLSKTSAAVGLLRQLHAFDDVRKVKETMRTRAGKGKFRGRRWNRRKGPLLVHSGRVPAQMAFRNLPGFEICDVSRLNLLQLAPGGHVGRFVIWTKSAFQKLDRIYGTGRSSGQKKDFVLPRSCLSNADIARIINSDEVQSQLRDPIKRKRAHHTIHRKNPLKNLGVMLKLNPHHAAATRKRVLDDQARAKKNKTEKKRNKSRNTRFTQVLLQD